MPESTGIASHLSEPVSVLEKTAKLHYFLLLTNLLLTLDIALVFFYQRNVLALTYKSPELNIGNAILFITAFSFLLSLFFPVLRMILGWLVINIYYCKWCVKLHDNQPQDRAYKFSSLVKQNALEARDEFDYKRAVEFEQEQKKNDATLNLAFSAALLLATDYFIDIQNVHSIMQHLASYLKSINGFWLTLIGQSIYAVFLLAFGVLAWRSLRPPSEDDKMYLPKPDDNKLKKTFSGVPIDTTLSTLDTRNPKIEETYDL